MVLLCGIVGERCRGRKSYITPAFSGVPNKGDNIKAQKQKKTLPTLSLTLLEVLQIAPHWELNP